MRSSLFLERLLILTETGKVAYDENFHRGVNIIRGMNSSGKSTIIRFIFFALGGDYTDFTPQAMLCRSVYVQVEIRGTVLTLRRDLEKQDGQVRRMIPMYIYYGTIDESLKGASLNWQRYGYKTTPDRRSFSNILFTAMGLPQMRTDSNITMHQILRLVYLDQESPLSSLFLFEFFDKEITRDTVAQLLMGLYDEKLSQAKLRRLELNRLIEEKQQEIKASERFLTDPQTRSRAFLQAHIDKLTTQIQDILMQVAVLRANARQSALNGQVNMEYIRLQEKVAALRTRESGLKEEIYLLENDIRDSAFFVHALKRKTDALQRSIATRNYFGSLHLAYCPECLSRIDDNVVEDGHCRLCKSAVDSGQGESHALRIKLELQFQIRESESLIQGKQGALKRLKSTLVDVQNKLQTAQRQYDDALHNVRSTSDEQIDQLLQDKGFKEGEILQYQTMLEHAGHYEQLLSELDEYKAEAGRLDRYIDSAQQTIARKRASVENAITANGIYLLKHDRFRQSEFSQATSFKMDFAQNVVYLNNLHIKLSASSSFYLKMAARFAFFLSSVEQDSMMYPRLILSDNMEDKGLEEERSRNFQKVLVDRLGQINPPGAAPDYQVIFATSMIAPELDIPTYTIGDSYTQQNKSLKNID